MLAACGGGRPLPSSSATTVTSGARDAGGGAGTAGATMSVVDMGTGGGAGTSSFGGGGGAGTASSGGAAGMSSGGGGGAAGTPQSGGGGAGTGSGGAAGVQSHWPLVWTIEGSMTFLELPMPASAMSADGLDVAQAGTDDPSPAEGASPAGAMLTNDGRVPPGTNVGLGALAASLPLNMVSGIDGSGRAVIGNAAYRASLTLRASPNDPWQEAFRWTLTDGIAGLGFTKPGHDKSTVAAVSWDGAAVAGTSAHSPDGFSNDDQEAFLWTAALGTHGLGALAGDTMSLALALSADGSTVIGVSSTAPLAGGQLFAWKVDGGFTALGPALATNERYLTASASVDGSVVAGTLLIQGNAGGGSEQTESFRWTAAGGLQRLGGLDGRVNSQTLGLSADGSVIVGSTGSAIPIGADTVAFRWTANQGMQALPLPAGATSSFPFAMTSDASVVLGSASGIASELLWDKTGGILVLYADAPAFSARCRHQTTLISDDGKTLAGVCNPTATPPGSGPTGFVARFR